MKNREICMPIVLLRCRIRPASAPILLLGRPTWPKRATSTRVLMLLLGHPTRDTRAPILLLRRSNRATSSQILLLVRPTRDTMAPILLMRRPVRTTRAPIVLKDNHRL